MTPDFLTGSKVGVKICGIRSIDDAILSVQLGADSLGFNFWSKSKRYVTRDQVKEWSDSLDENIERVGVFVNADPDEVISLLEDNVIHVAQFHGDETIAYCENIAKNHKVIRAVGVEDAASLNEVNFSKVGSVLLDAYCPENYGGTGRSFEWDLGAAFVQQNPDARIILAGGLNPNNVSEAIKLVRPSAVDVASGVESDDGFKDPELIKQFINAANIQSV
ncbi:MAG: phosphoribosylanthranilate isomerase [Verrucomicrobiota bacterium]|nr:phosphoribosylanthranilate isomerase [Verrucomicrobiota bacterium]